MCDFPTHLAYQAVHSPPLNPPYTREPVAVHRTSEPCALCGFETGEGVDKWDVLSDRFTDFDVFAEPSSPILCPACAYCLKTEGEYMMKFVFLATPDEMQVYVRDKGEGVKRQFENCKVLPLNNTDNETLRNSMADIFWNLPVDKPFVFSIHTTGNGQHHILRSRVNHSIGNGFFIQVDQTPVWVPPYEVIKPLWEAIAECRAQGIFREYIEGIVPYPVPTTTLKPAEQKRWEIWSKNKAVLAEHARTAYINLLVEQFVPKGISAENKKESEI